jgi:DNA-binding transcriptional LysR family regulator
MKKELNTRSRAVSDVVVHLGLLPHARAAGFASEVVQEAAQTQTMLGVVAAGLGVALVVETAAKTALHGISFVSVTDLPDSLASEMYAAWSPAVESAPRAS